MGGLQAVWKDELYLGFEICFQGCCRMVALCILMEQPTYKCFRCYSFQKNLQIARRYQQPSDILSEGIRRHRQPSDKFLQEYC